MMYAQLRKYISLFLLFIFSFQILVHSLHQYEHFHALTKTEKNHTNIHSSYEDCSICNFVLPTVLEPSFASFTPKTFFAFSHYAIIEVDQICESIEYLFSLRAPPFMH